jgi:hypothetical protein
MLKRRSHAVDFSFLDALFCGLVAPLRGGLPDLRRYFGGLLAPKWFIFSNAITETDSSD